MSLSFSIDPGMIQGLAILIAVSVIIMSLISHLDKDGEV